MDPEKETEGHAEPHDGRNIGGQTGGEEGVSGAPGAEGRPESQEGGNQEGGGAPDRTDEGSGNGPAQNLDQEDSGSLGYPALESRPKNQRVSRQTFRAAYIAGKGNRPAIAAALGYDQRTVLRRIREDPELNALYGDGDGDPPSETPGEMSVLNRNGDDLPAHVAVEIGQVDAADMAQYYTALKAYGVSDERIQKLKSLDGLARNWATHVSISLRGHHQSYDGQLHNLAEVAESIKKKLDGVVNADGTITQLDAESYSYLAKVYVECVKETGKGVGMMLTLTEALVRMIGAKNEIVATKAVSGWGPMKKVRKAS